jgi:hypothetical protein
MTDTSGHVFSAIAPPQSLQMPYLAEPLPEALEPPAWQALELAHEHLETLETLEHVAAMF